METLIQKKVKKYDLAWSNNKQLTKSYIFSGNDYHKPQTSDGSGQRSYMESAAVNYMQRKIEFPKYQTMKNSLEENITPKNQIRQNLVKENRTSKNQTRQNLVRAVELHPKKHILSL